MLGIVNRFDDEVRLDSHEPVQVPVQAKSGYTISVTTQARAGDIVEAKPLGSGGGFGKALSIEAPTGYLADVGLGDSIALSGACMTVVRLEPETGRFDVEISAESLDKTAGLDAPTEMVQARDSFGPAVR